MNVESDAASATSQESSGDDTVAQESLTDLIDRMDREAFRRSLEQRDLRLLSVEIERPAAEPRRSDRPHVRA